MKDFNLINWLKVVQSIDSVDDQTQHSHNLLSKISQKMQLVTSAIKHRSQIIYSKKKRANRLKDQPEKTNLKRKTVVFAK